MGQTDRPPRIARLVPDTSNPEHADILAFAVVALAAAGGSMSVKFDLVISNSNTIPDLDGVTLTVRIVDGTLIGEVEVDDAVEGMGRARARVQNAKR